MTTTRNMEVTDVAGEIIACVVTQWAVIDLDKRVAVDLRGHVDYSKALTDNPCPVEKPMRITHVNPTQYREHEVVYSDLDFNRHVNAMKYLVWMFDMLPLELAAEKLLARIDINFMHEARYGQVLKIGLEQGDDSIFEITEEEGQALCRAAMKWK